MSKRKGLGIEEKRKRMLEIFYDTREELEKIAPKEKGIVAQSVKDVVQSLVDDAYVDTEKLGISVYFWAFPSKAMIIRKRKIEELESKLSAALVKTEELDQKIKQTKISRNDTPEREQILKNMTHLASEVDCLQKLMEKLTDCDPAVISQEKADVQVFKNATDRWTENIFAMRTWLKNKFFLEEDVLNKQFCIPENLDYID